MPLIPDPRQCSQVDPPEANPSSPVEVLPCSCRPEDRELGTEVYVILMSHSYETTPPKTLESEQ